MFENLTIHNLTPQGGSQAEALRLQGCDQCVVRHADIISLQDTLLWSGRIYANDCYIEGNVDYVWGTGAAFFDHCEIKTAGRAGYLVQARNPASTSGYVFVDSKLTADASVTGDMLGRIDVSVYPASQVAYINCQMGKHISPVGWTVTGGVAGGSSALLGVPERRPVRCTHRCEQAARRLEAAIGCRGDDAARPGPSARRLEAAAIKRLLTMGVAV